MAFWLAFWQRSKRRETMFKLDLTPSIPLPQRGRGKTPSPRTGAPLSPWERGRGRGLLFASFAFLSFASFAFLPSAVLAQDLQIAGKIAFRSDRDGNGEIYVMNADGTNQTRLTNNSAEDIWPSWSPDGTKIAFMSDRDGNGEIYVMNADGTNQTRLTNNSATEYCPSWSPDGTKIVFMSNRDGGGDSGKEI